MATLYRGAAFAGFFAAALLATASSYAACTPADINGSALPAASHADRTITIRPNTKSLNVKYGETVKFVMEDGREAIWKFDGLAGKLNLSTIMAQPLASAGSSAAPPRNVPVYVDQASNPLNAACAGD